MRRSAAAGLSARHLQSRPSVMPWAGYGSREETRPRAGRRDVLLPGWICVILSIGSMWGLEPIFQTFGSLPLSRCLTDLLSRS
jgi:hypothetical protein